jgi:branched-chain amino acid transport system permease protein
VSPRVIVRGSVEHRVWQVLGWLCVLAVAVYVLGPGKDYLVLRWAQAVTLGIAILGLNLVTGYSGQVSLGHSAFFGIGAYTTMILVADHGWPFLATLPVAGAIGFAIGALVGLPALRIRDLYLTLVTLGIALAFPSIVKKMESLTGGGNGKTITVGQGDVPNGFRWKAPSWVPGHLDDNAWIFVTVFLIAIVMFLLASNLVRSRVGRATVAMRDNEIGAISSGIDSSRVKVMAFAVSALWTAVGGGCFALAGSTIAPDSFGLQRSIELIAGLVIGGIATIVGPALGGVIVEFLPYLSFNAFPGPEAYVLYGLILIVLVFFMPGGIVAGIRLVKARVVRVLPRLPDISAPAPIPESTTGDRAAPVR